MRISDWSSDVCSSDLIIEAVGRALAVGHLLVIIVESDRGEAGLAFVEIGAAEQVLREVGAAMLRIFLDDRLQLRLGLGIEFRQPQAVAVDLGVLGRIGACRFLDSGVRLSSTESGGGTGSDKRVK